MDTTLYNFYDPMCSWCYAFEPVWGKIQEELAGRIIVRRILGGLAPDDDAPMPDEMRQYIKGAWRRIEEMVPGTVFDFSYWDICVPRRSTYPACRAVIAARKQGEIFEVAMLHAVQRAYFRQARNPSDHTTHIQLAEELGLDCTQFEIDLSSRETQLELAAEVEFTGSLNIPGYPCLVLFYKGGYHHIPHDYTMPQPALEVISGIIKP